ncbi:hypothetical protein C8J56DRAFT_1037213 [Mycena floridula]|nr:hypothetical protein C8J56DRAFT_1037213 [Mycena floridula]
MKFNLVKLIPFFIAVAAVPAPEPEPAAAVNRLGESVDAAAAITCTITGNLVRYRTCPKTSCTALGEYPINTKVSLLCYTSGTVVNGDQFWDKTSAGHYVSEYYVDFSCASQLPPC